ncbi:MarR family winged helix-turn-helix transcriptional regulator [Demequina salsinemoris]|uniref:MarR family winged helix-turn-helix transcriptional regulator n=1 Tax=Demequina salsinemoris TaxID=577470 RepID=UPI000784BA62|nr:MarR family transcriptional regulator [Demequina salsinemoris]
MTDSESASEDTLETARRLRLAINRIRRLSRQAGEPSGVTRSQEVVLLVLRRQGPLSTAELAEIERVRPQSMGEIVRGLVEIGMVTKEPHPTDGRRELVTLTRVGKAVVERSSASRDAELADLIASRLDNEARATLDDALEVLERLAAEK